MRCRVRELLVEDATELNAHGTNQHAVPMKMEQEQRGVYTINSSSKGGTRAEYLTRRLKRDRPDLATRVASGELSAHAAAVEAGFLKRTMQIVPSDPWGWRVENGIFHLARPHQ